MTEATICADCEHRHVADRGKPGEFDKCGALLFSRRNFVTGEPENKYDDPVYCSVKNSGRCPDFTPKQEQTDAE